MNYIVALIIPPLALLLSRSIFHAIFNVVLLCLAIFILFASLGIASPIAWGVWMLAILHAMFVIHGNRVNRGVKKQLDEMEKKLDASQQENILE